MKSHCMFRRVVVGAICAGAIVLASVSLAQQRSQNLFRGNWKGTLSPDIVVGVPEGHRERLSQPVDFELRVFNRGRAELYFSSDEVEWVFVRSGEGQLEMQVTEIGANGTILGRLTGTADDSRNAFSFNLTKVDDETLLVNWTMLSIQSVLRFDGLDEFGFAGTDLLTLD